MTDAALADLDSLDKETLKALLIRERSSSLQQIEHLKLVIEKLRRMLFGAKSEKLAGELEQLEL
jgi:Fe-S cluster biosynthesis and repair protein YggX